MRAGLFLLLVLGLSPFVAADGRPCDGGGWEAVWESEARTVCRSEATEGLPRYLSRTTTRGDTWSRGVLFHAPDESSVHGTLLVRVDASLFDFTEDSTWRPASLSSVSSPSCTDEHAFDYLGGACTWCPLASETHDGGCSRGRLVAGHIQNEALSRELDEEGLEIVRQRLFLVRNAARFLPMYRTVWLRCGSLSIPANTVGRFRIEAMPDFVATVNARHPARLLSSLHSEPLRPPGVAVCVDSPLVGVVDAPALASLFDHHTDPASVNAGIVLVYDVGLSGIPLASHPLVTQIEGQRTSLYSPRLIVVDLRDELQGMYGSGYAAFDAWLFAPRFGRVAIRRDCALRAKSAGAQWVVFLHRRAFLVLNERNATLTKLLEQIPSSVSWVALDGFQTLSEPRPNTTCSCGADSNKPLDDDDRDPPPLTKGKFLPTTPYFPVVNLLSRHALRGDVGSFPPNSCAYSSGRSVSTTTASAWELTCLQNARRCMGVHPHVQPTNWNVFVDLV